MQKKRVFALLALLLLVGTSFLFFWKERGLSSPPPLSQNESIAPLPSRISLAKERSKALSKRLSSLSSYKAKIKELKKELSFAPFDHHPTFTPLFNKLHPKERYLFLLLASLHQFDHLFQGFEELQEKEKALKSLSSLLVQTEDFYAPIGGFLGYYDTVVTLMSSQQAEADPKDFLPPPFVDMRKKDETVWKACYQGFYNLDRVGHVFVLGGAGDRLNLVDEKTQEALPAARLLFCGRTLFEGLMRDTEALEYWHFRAFGNDVTSPILMMTSMEKHNDDHIKEMCEKAHWFERPQEKVRRIVQKLVPMIDVDGDLAISSPLEIMVKPGGHGVFWTLAKQEGAISWLEGLGCDFITIRQINNPLSGLDQTLPSLIGYGVTNGKGFGFASCPSKPGFAEGMNVLSLQRSNEEVKASITNIEYTQFAQLKKVMPDLFKEGVCPANTNILLAHLPDIERVLFLDPFPGAIVNPKTPVEVDRDGKKVNIMCGRLEPSIQNIADVMKSPIDATKLPFVNPEFLSTFLLLQDREKLISVAKKAYQGKESALETPLSCLYDFNKTMQSLMREYCKMALPEEKPLNEFLETGPSCLILLNPCLGPLFEVIGQKIQGGSILPGSLLELEIAEISCQGLSLQGSFSIIAKNITGSHNQEERHFSDKVGRAFLKNVHIENKGSSLDKPEAILQGTFDRGECCEIVLEGFSEVYADGITFKGPFSLHVPDGQRARLSQSPSGEIHTLFEPIEKPSWSFLVDWKEEAAPTLTYQETL